MAKNNSEDRKINQLALDTKDLSDDLKLLLDKEIKEHEKRETKRSSEILAIFAAHNYYADGCSPEELRTTLEDLGPTYVKIGQIMSSRVDILPESFCKELEKLRSTVKPLDSEVARAVVEQETGKKIDELFSEFKDKPIGSASVGQVHYAVLKDGTPVVVKVQRPLIADMMAKDFELLRKLGGLANVFLNDGGTKSLDLLSTIEEFEKVTADELDFTVEAEMTKFFKENCIEDEEKISCPTVIEELTTPRLFTMTFVNGVSLAKKDYLIEQGVDLNEIGKVLIENYAHQILDVGVFHADPHQGNIMVADGKPYWIDFGMIGRLSPSDIDFIQDLVIACITADGDKLVKCIVGLGATTEKTNLDKLQDDAVMMFSKYANVTGVSDLDMTTLFDELTGLMDTHSIELPGRFTMLFRSIITIEGVIEDICPQLNLLEILSGKMTARMKEKFNLKDTLIKTGKELIDIGGKSIKIPALISDSLGLLNKGKMKVNMEVTGLDGPLDLIGEFCRYTILSVFACVLFLGSCILCMTDMEPKVAGDVPLIAVFGILFSIALAIFAVRKLWNMKKNKK